MITDLSVDLGGPVHYVDHGGAGPTFVCVHGLGGSSLNWLDLAPRLAEHGRVYALDLAGHGQTPRAGRSASVVANQRLLDTFLRTVTGTPVILVGNSMGGMIALLESAANPAHVAGLVLIDPAIPGPLRSRPDAQVLAGLALSAVPVLGPRLLLKRQSRLGATAQVHETLNLCTVDRSRINPEIVEATISQAEQRSGDPDNATSFLQASRSVLATIGRQTTLRAAIRKVSVPTLLIHGEKDRLVPVRTAREAAKARPDWAYVELPDLGHVPMLEAPGQTADVIDGWLASAGKAALADATVGG